MHACMQPLLYGAYGSSCNLAAGDGQQHGEGPVQAARPAIHLAAAAPAASAHRPEVADGHEAVVDAVLHEHAALVDGLRSHLHGDVLVLELADAGPEHGGLPGGETPRQIAREEYAHTAHAHTPRRGASRCCGPRQVTAEADPHSRPHAATAMSQEPCLLLLVPDTTPSSARLHPFHLRTTPEQQGLHNNTCGVAHRVVWQNKLKACTLA